MVDGRECIVRPSFDKNIEEYLRPLFEQYYTMSFDNYPVEMERLEGADIRECGKR
jgi:formylmethanofuran dehydrogenase subunit A